MSAAQRSKRTIPPDVAEGLCEATRSVLKRVKEDQALIERGPKTPAEWADLANARTLTEEDQETVIRRLSGYLLARGLDAALVLRLMFAFDTACGHPSIGLGRVEELVTWVVERDTERLRGESK